MSHTSTKIYRDTVNGEGVSIGDIQTVLGSSRNDIGGLITYGDIKVCAKNKPIRSDKLGILTAADRASKRYGFSSSIPTLTITQSIPLANWTYLRPRGIHGTASNPGSTSADDEWYRFLDFDGYDAKAGCPICIQFGAAYADDKAYIVAYFNSYSDAGRSQVGYTGDDRWTADGSVSMEDLLGLSGFYDYYLAFILWDNDTGECNLIRTGCQISDICAAGSTAMQVFTLYANGYAGDADDEHYPAVPILQGSTRMGDDFTAIACLTPSPGTPTINNRDYYTVVSTNVSSWTPYSLGIENGADRGTTTLTTLYSIANATGSTSISAVATNTYYTPFSDVFARAFDFTVSAAIDTTNCSDWYTASALHVLSVEAVVRVYWSVVSGAGQVYMSSDGNPESYEYIGAGMDENGSYFEYVKPITLANQAQFNRDLLYHTNDYVYNTQDRLCLIYVESGGASSASIKAKAWLRHAGESDVALTISSSVTISYND